MERHHTCTCSMKFNVTLCNYCQHHLHTDDFSQAATQVYIAFIATAELHKQHALHQLASEEAYAHGKRWVAMHIDHRINKIALHLQMDIDMLLGNDCLQLVTSIAQMQLSPVGHVNVGCVNHG